MTNNVKCVIIGLGVILVAVLGSIFSNLGMEWYNTLTMPSEWPPKFLFPVVWSTVYILAIITLCMVVRANCYNDKKIITLGIINGVLNVLWCLVFFALKQLFLGNVIIIFNVIAAFYFITELRRCGNLYFFLMLIYPLWVSLATSLNLAVWILN